MLFILGILGVFITGFICGAMNEESKKKIKQSQMLDKLSLYYQMLNMWLEMKQKGKSIVTYLKQKGINRIAIYGMKELGERLYEEVKNTEIEVVCIIDKTPNLVIGDFMVISPEEEIPQVDAIIVTADYYFQEIEELFKSKVSCPIYSLNGVLGNSFGRYL